MEAFIRSALGLKDTSRAGWTRVLHLGRLRVESVADHSWSLALLALLFAERRPELDRERLLTLAIVHDLAEAVVGDLTPGDYGTKDEKRALERAGLDRLLADAPHPFAARVRAAWEDYETRTSPEARLIADLDKLEMALQATRYAQAGGDGAELREFAESAHAAVRDPEVRGLVEGALHHLG